MKYKILLSLAAAAAFLPATLSAGDDKPFVFSDNSLIATIEANGRDVLITGSHNDLTITGTCPHLTITGECNYVRVFNPSSVMQNGMGNEVVWTKDPNSKAPGVKDSQTNITHPGN